MNLHTGIGSSDISNANITSIIADATAQVNSDINVQVERESISSIDSTRTNKIDGSNTVYYLKKWRGNFLADSDNDGAVSTTDVAVYQVDSNGTETTLTVSAVDDATMKITLSSAPASGVRLYITYSYCPVRQGTVDKRVKMAAVFLSAAYCYAKINIGKAPSMGFGSTRLTRDMESYNHYMQRYVGITEEIQRLGGIVVSAVSPLTI